MVQHRFFIVHEKDASGKKVCFCPLNGPAKWKCNEKNADMGKMSEKLRIFQPSKIRKGERQMQTRLQICPSPETQNQVQEAIEANANSFANLSESPHVLCKDKV